MIIGFIVWQIFNIIIGFIEGAYWHYRNIVVLNQVFFKTPYANTQNLHPILFLLRVLFAITILFSCKNEPILSLILLSVALIISQPYFHLGVMYWHRNKLDSRNYKKGFFDTNVVEKGESSKIDLMLKKQISYRMRLVAFIISIILLIFAVWI